MPTGEIVPNTAYFAALCASEKQSTIAHKAGISVNTLRAILRGTPVMKGTMETIAKNLQVNINLLFAQSTEHVLPTARQFYEDLRFGYFLDHDRRAFGEVKWWRETVKFRPATAEPNHIPGIPFTGEFTNQWNNVFRISAVLSNCYHFSVVGTHELTVDDTSAGNITFAASFSQCVDGVLSGVWSGINHFESAQALFRIFLSHDELTQRGISKLSERIRVELHRDSEYFGFGD